MNLDQRFTDLWTRLGATGDATPIRTRLISAYSEPHRHYHNLEHLRECLETLDENRSLARDADEVEMALWFHDAVYEPRGKDNEEQSAALAESLLAGAGVDPERVARIADHIRATVHAEAAGDADARLVADIDLTPLAVSWPEFSENSTKLRQEYHIVPDLEFLAGRSAFLVGLLAREAIYSTPAIRDKLEHQARQNVLHGLLELQFGKGAPKKE